MRSISIRARSVDLLDQRSIPTDTPARGRLSSSITRGAARAGIGSGETFRPACRGNVYRATNGVGLVLEPARKNRVPVPPSSLVQEANCFFQAIGAGNQDLPSVVNRL